MGEIMAIVFHGITDKAYRQFGDKSGIISPWVCSDNDGCMYFHTAEFIQSEYDCDDMEEIINQGVQLASESAAIQSSINDDCTFHVIIADVPEEYLNVDYSCENMEHCRFVWIDQFRQEWIKEIRHFEISRYLHVFRIAGLLNNNQFNKYGIDNYLLKTAEIIAKTDYYSAVCDELYEFNEIK